MTKNCDHCGKPLTSDSQQLADSFVCSACILKGKTLTIKDGDTLLSQDFSGILADARKLYDKEEAARRAAKIKPLLAIIRKCHFDGPKCDCTGCPTLVCQMCTDDEEKARLVARNWQAYNTSVETVNDALINNERIDPRSRAYMAGALEAHTHRYREETQRVEESTRGEGSSSREESQETGTDHHSSDT